MASLVVAALVFMAAVVVQLAALALAQATASAAPNPVTVSVANAGSNSVTPITVATNTPGTPIPVGSGPVGIRSHEHRGQHRPRHSSASTCPPRPLRTPSAAGSVQFKDGTTSIGSPATVTNGAASITTTLGSGAHTLTAVFAPTDPAAFGSSTSNTVSYVVNAPSGAKATITTLRVAPNHAFEGIAVIFLTNVAPRGATGTIQLMDGTTTLGCPAGDHRLRSDDHHDAAKGHALADRGVHSHKPGGLCPVDLVTGAADN
jgi:hypothetical protein